MSGKITEKNKAIKLRQEGKTYSEILKIVPVAKSTLSLWLREVGLAKRQRQRITEKRIQGQKRAAESRRTQRITLCNKIFEKSEKQVGVLNEREFWLMGVMLYWAEGSKEKENHPGSRMCFTNTDPRMIKMHISWLLSTFDITINDLEFTIAIHRLYKNRIKGVKLYWSNATNIPLSFFSKVQYKKHNPKTNRKNIGIMYNGCLRVVVKRSSNMLRQITGWTRGVCLNSNCGIV